ncbi:MAG: TIGR03905 family TSCPD domain-containing protein [Clostridia bacterium]|nr:TIGR03905 family TSCPD domain-containing protein [Clostridia bacterium]
MANTFVYKTKGTCSREITVTLDGDTIESISFLGGCNGNLQGVSALCKGRKIDEVIETLSGIKCGFKNTSCPDQLAQALKSAQNQNT